MITDNASAKTNRAIADLVTEWISFWGAHVRKSTLHQALRAFEQNSLDAKPAMLISAVARSGTHSMLELHEAGRSIWPLMYASRNDRDLLN